MECEQVLRSLAMSAKACEIALNSRAADFGGYLVQFARFRLGGWSDCQKVANCFGEERGDLRRHRMAFKSRSTE